MIRKYTCLESFPNTDRFKKGDIVEIEKLSAGGYIIDGAIKTDRETVYKFFKIINLPGFNHAPYSHSKMETWSSCPKKFEFNYIINPPRTETPNSILEKGTLFHGILEFDMVDKLDKFELPDTFKALNKNDASTIIEQALNFTETSDAYKWIKSLNGLKVPEQEMFLNEKLEPTDSLEKSLIRGFIDLIIHDKDNNKCYIFDWKTGGKSKENLKKWPKSKDQLELYAIWANENFKVEEIETAFVYVEHDHMAKYTFKSKDIPALKKKFLTKINDIEGDTKFVKNTTQLCAWCDFRELCLGIDINRNPRDISKEEIMNASKSVGEKKTKRKQII